MHQTLRKVLLSSALLMTCSCQQQPSSSQSVDHPEPEPIVNPQQDHIHEILSAMTLEEKAGQLFIVRPDALVPGLSQEEIDQTDGQGVTAVSEEMLQSLAEIPVGGIILFGKNIEDSDQLTTFIQQFQQTSEKIGMWMAVDEEGGVVARLANHPSFALPKYESASAVGAQGEQAVYEMYQTIGSYLHQYGFQIDFAPVADINSNPHNPIIGTRAFASTGEAAAPLVAGAVRGLQEQGVYATLKHFPGHGDTDSDTHQGTVAVHASIQQLRSQEFLPFQAGIDAGAQFVMAGHINTPEITDDGLPASLSQQILTGYLRRELGFEGLIITDALCMKAITNQFTTEEACILALQAGADILLMPSELPEAYRAVVEAVKDGRLSEERIDESVLRILRAKEKVGLVR